MKIPDEARADTDGPVHPEARCSSIMPHDPLRLADAARLAYPLGGMTASGLRRERDAGRLVTELTAGKEFTTLADIDWMREMCRRRQPARVTDASPDLAKIDDTSAARASALRIADALLAKASEPLAERGKRTRRNRS